MDKKNLIILFLIVEILIGLLLYFNLSMINDQDSFVSLNLDSADDLKYDTTSPHFGVFDYLRVYKGTVKYKEIDMVTIARTQDIELYVQIGSRINKNMMIAASEEGNIYSDFEGFVLNINYGDQILLECVRYENIYINVNVTLDQYKNMRSNDELYVYANHTKYDVQLERFSANHNGTYDLTYDILHFDQVYFENESLNIYQTTQGSATVYINKTALGDKIADNTYQIWVIDPSLEKSEPSPLIVEIGRQNDYFVEIISDNLQLYFEILDLSN